MWSKYISKIPDGPNLHYNQKLHFAELLISLGEY